jgi:hypothetical protein
VKLVHLVGFITKEFVTMRGHMNIKKTYRKSENIKLWGRTGQLAIAICCLFQQPLALIKSKKCSKYVDTRLVLSAEQGHQAESLPLKICSRLSFIVISLNKQYTSNKSVCGR